MSKTVLSRNLSRSAQVARALDTLANAVLALSSALKGEAAAVPAGSFSLSQPSHTTGLLPVTGTLSPPPDGCTVQELINEFLRAKARAGRSDRYLRALRVSLRSFGRGRLKQDASKVTVQDLEAWLQKSEWAPRTQRGYLSDVRVLYNFGQRRNLVARNPAAGVELPVMESEPPAIHTPEQARTVLEFARGYDLNICRALAIRYFAGLRSAEANRLEEKEIRDGLIEVTAAKAKTRQRRLVTIQPNLAAWLALGGQLPLHDLSNRWRWFTARLKKAHGLVWDFNVTRHSFVSYHLAQFQNAGKTALEAGHTEQMTFAHYRALVTPAAAAEYWKIFPRSSNAKAGVGYRSAKCDVAGLQRSI